MCVIQIQNKFTKKRKLDYEYDNEYCKIITLSDTLLEKTKWWSYEQYVGDLYEWIKKNHNLPLDFSSNIGSLLRTMKPKDYFILVSYVKYLNNSIL